MYSYPIQPPRVARFLLRLSLHEVDADSVLDDLEEIFVQLCETENPTAAKRWYWSQVVRSFPTFLILSLSWSFVMLKNYLKIAVRSIVKQKGLSFINIFSLSVGIAFCALIFLFVRDELTFDQFHENKDRLFLVESIWFDPDGSENRSESNNPVPLGPALQDEIPEVESYVRTRDMVHFVRSRDEASEERVLYADPQIFSVFSFPFREGNPEAALYDRTGVVLSEHAAQKYFGVESALGEILQIRLNDVFEDFVVIGVAENVPGNSSIQFDILLPFDRIFETERWERFTDIRESWQFVAIQNYVLLKESASVSSTRAKMPNFALRHYPLEEGDEAYVTRSYRLRPITEVHMALRSEASYSYILSGIAFAILFIACINFMTLAIGRSSTRSREVGIRKMVGAHRRQLMWQFWGESLLLSVLALVIATLLAELFLPVFSGLTGKELSFDYARDWTTIAGMGAIVVLAGLMGGSYPAFVISGFKPIESLSNRLRLGGSNAFTKSLVVVQFALSVFLIIGTLVMHNQLQYAQNLDPGFKKDQVVIIPVSGTDPLRVADRFRTMIGGHSLIQGITATNVTLGNSSTHGTRYDHDGKTHTLSVYRVETNYLDFMGLELVRGRNFDPALATDSTESLLVNEALVRDFELVDPIGQVIPGYNEETAPVIVGVVKDYNFQSLYKEVAPVVLTMDSDWRHKFLLVRISPTNISDSIDLLRTTWAGVLPDLPFEFTFLDEHMRSIYEADVRWSNIISYASIFAIIIACLGLLGLSALTVRTRTKEIGIRKVLGATASRISLLLSREFIWLVLGGIVIAVPVAYLVMQKWLETFAYRIELGVGLFVISGILAVVVAIATVSFQSVKAALTNPVDSIRADQ